MPNEPVAGASLRQLESRVLVLPPTSADGAAIKKLFEASGMSLAFSRTAAELCAAMTVGAGTIVVAEEALLADPGELIECIDAQPVWSDLPIIVLSRSGYESLWLVENVPRLGNVSVVERPVRTSTLISLVRSALRARARQYQVRQHLAEEKQAQKIIRETEQRYRSVIENIADYAIFLTDPQGCVLTWNSGAGAVLGYEAQEILGQPVDRFSKEDDIAARASESEMREASSGGRSVTARWRIRKDGAPLFLEGVITAVRDEGGALAGFSYFLRDVTQKQRIETEREQLLQSERAARSQVERVSRTKDEFLATLSHELRTPLNAVLGWTQVLKNSRDLPSEALNALTVIERNARAQAQIIEDLLDMSSIISGKVRLDVQRLDLAAVVEATVETVRPAAVAKGIRLQVVLDPLAGPVRGDPNRLQQVLWNLLANAVKFTPRSGRVHVALARVDSHLEVEISDSGEGIDPAFLPYVFDRFRQADSSASRRHGGLGLGLSIVKQLVEMHGGSISAKSAGPNMGSTFRVALPVMASMDDSLEPQVAGAHPTRSASSPTIDAFAAANLAGVTVLVVDDEADARNLIQRVLRDNKAEVITAGSALEALELLGVAVPDVLISDIGLPGEDGYSFIRRVRSMGDGGARVPAIALTAYARVEDRVKAINAGFQLHLSKPVEPVELIAMVASLARRPG